MGRKTTLSKALKTFSRLFKDKMLDEARNYFPAVQKALDKAVKQGILKANTASRKKSRLSKRIKA